MMNSVMFWLKKRCRSVSQAAFVQGIFRKRQNDCQPGWRWGQVSVEKAYSIFLLFLFCKAQKVKIGIQGHMGGGRRRHNKQPALGSLFVCCHESESEEGLFTCLWSPSLIAPQAHLQTCSFWVRWSQTPHSDRPLYKAFLCTSRRLCSPWLTGNGTACLLSRDRIL